MLREIRSGKLICGKYVAGNKSREMNLREMNLREINCGKGISRNTDIVGHKFADQKLWHMGPMNCGTIL